jgi:hypothetical protein
MRGLHGALLNLIAEDPPSWPGERWFGADLCYLDPEELQVERQRLKLRLLLTDPRERSRWPSTWLRDRLQKCERLLRVRVPR